MPVEPDPEPEAEPTEPEQPAEPDDAEHDEDEAGGAEQAEAEAEDDTEDNPQRRGLLNFGNTDLAFAGDRLFVGSYHGFNTYRVEVPASPQLVTSVVCPRGAG